MKKLVMGLFISTSLFGGIVASAESEVQNEAALFDKSIVNEASTISIVEDSIDWNKPTMSIKYSSDYTKIESITSTSSMWGLGPVRLTINGEILGEKTIKPAANGTYTVHLKDFNNGHFANATDAIYMDIYAEIFPGYPGYILDYRKSNTSSNIILPTMSSLEGYDNSCQPPLMTTYNVSTGTYNVDVQTIGGNLLGVSYEYSIINEATGQVVASNSGTSSSGLQASFYGDGSSSYILKGKFIDNYWGSVAYGSAKIYSIKESIQ